MILNDILTVADSDVVVYNKDGSKMMMIYKSHTKQCADFLAESFMNRTVTTVKDTPEGHIKINVEDAPAEEPTPSGEGEDAGETTSGSEEETTPTSEPTIDGTDGGDNP